MYTDEKLACLAAGRNEGAFQELHKRYQAWLMRWLMRKHELSEHDAEDVSQDTWATISQALPDYDGGTFRPWFFCFAFRRMIDFKRSRSAAKHKRVSDRYQVGEEYHPVDYREVRRSEQSEAKLIWEYAVYLPQRQRQALKLRYALGVSDEEAASVLQISEPTLRKDIRLAKEKLEVKCADVFSLGKAA